MKNEYKIYSFSPLVLKVSPAVCSPLDGGSQRGVAPQNESSIHSHWWPKDHSINLVMPHKRCFDYHPYIERFRLNMAVSLYFNKKKKNPNFWHLYTVPPPPIWKCCHICQTNKKNSQYLTPINSSTTDEGLNIYFYRKLCLAQSSSGALINTALWLQWKAVFHKPECEERKWQGGWKCHKYTVQWNVYAD